MTVVRTRIKFCGIRTRASLECASDLGVDAVGFVAVPDSPRALDLAQIAELMRHKPAGVLGVVLLVNPSPEEARELWRETAPDLLQFHGDESPEFCDALDIPYIKALRVGSPAAPELPAGDYRNARAMLYDTYSERRAGGTGETFDWNALPPEAVRQGVLAGGLTPDNVGEALRRLRPCAVDVSSGIERAPGEKCERLMQAFVRRVRAADADRAAGEA